MRLGAPVLAQWPVFALGALLHAIQLLLVLATVFDLERTAPGRWVPLAASLVLLAGCEAAVLALANGGLERLLGGARPRLVKLLDLLKALLLAILVALPAASAVKFRATGSHLRRSDLWFAYANWRQLLSEAQPREVAALLLLPAGAVGLSTLCFLGLRWTRRRGKAPGAGRVALATTLALAALALVWTRSPTLARFAHEFVAEVHWYDARLAAQRLAPAAGIPDSASGRPPITAYRPGPPRRPLNVVLVMLESVSWELAERRPVAAPTLLRLRDASVVFRRAYSPSTHSDYAQMAILSSLHPRKFPEHDFYLRLDYPRTLLWDALRPAGYSTAMFSCQNERWGNMLRYLDTPGLQTLRHAPDWPHAIHHGEGDESKVFEGTPVREWQRWLAGAAAEPFFTYLNFQATHFPYSVPPGAAEPFTPFALDFPATFVAYPRDRAPVMQNRFANALRYADGWLGEIVATLDRRGLAQRTLLVVVADHGEAFYEHEQPTHGTSLYEEQVRSLLLLHVPGIAPRRVDEPVSLLDVAPMVLRILGLPLHANFQGRDDVLEPAYSGRGRAFAFVLQGLVEQDGLLRDDLKWVVDRDRRSHRLYDLAHDPGERRDLSAERPLDAAALQAELDAFLARQLDYYGEQRWREGLYPGRLP